MTLGLRQFQYQPVDSQFLAKKISNINLISDMRVCLLNAIRDDDSSNLSNPHTWYVRF